MNSTAHDAFIVVLTTSHKRSELVGCISDLSYLTFISPVCTEIRASYNLLKELMLVISILHFDWFLW